MAWSTANDRAGTGVPGVVYDTILNNAIGALMNFTDPIYGEGVFIWLPGVASTVAGDVVEYTTGNGVANPTGSTTRWAGTANSGKPLAIATAAIVASMWGWYQISGQAVVNISGTVAAADKAYWQATGVVFSTLTAGKQVNGMVAVSANAVPAAGKATYQIQFPVAQGNIT